MAALKLEPFLARLRKMDEEDALDPDEIEALLRELRPRIKRKRFDEVAGHLREGYVRRAIEALDVPDAHVPRISLLVGTAFVVFAALSFHWGRSAEDQARASHNWPSVKGTVSSSRVGVSAPKVESQSRTYTADVKYSYRVGGKRFTGDRVSYRAKGDRESAEAVVARYPPGTRVQVHYNPEQPAMATLEVGLHETTGILTQGAWFFLGLGLIWLVGSVWIYWYRRP